MRGVIINPRGAATHPLGMKEEVQGGMGRAALSFLTLAGRKNEGGCTKVLYIQGSTDGALLLTQDQGVSRGAHTSVSHLFQSDQMDYGVVMGRDCCPRMESSPP